MWPDGARTAVVLGGSGWLGSLVCRGLEASGWRVVEVSRHPRRGRAAVACDLVDMDVAELGRLLAGSSVVVNCTDAVNATDGWDRPPEALTATNSALVGRLLEALRAVRPTPAMVHVGSITEYGPAGDRAWEESDPCHPASDYAASKLAGTESVLRARQVHGCRAMVLRVGNMVGPGATTAAFPGKVAAMAARAVRTGTDLRVTVAPDHRDFVDVRDVADGVVAAIGSDFSVGLLNLASGETTPVGAMVDELVRASGLPSHRVRIDRADVASFAGSRTWASNRLARSTLQWAPTRSLEESIDDMWRSVGR